MINSFQFDFTDSELVNYLWPQLVEKLGYEKAGRAISQALDLQSMYGSSKTLPVLFFETCGLAVARIDWIRIQTGLGCHGNRIVRIRSTKKCFFQRLKDY